MPTDAPQKVPAPLDALVKCGTLYFYAGTTTMQAGRITTFCNIFIADGTGTVVDVFNKIVANQKREYGTSVALTAFNEVGA